MDDFGFFPFLLFPREIQLHVLFYLEAPDILRFREVSKAFLELASDTTAAYNVQLDIVGMVDNPPQGSSLIERHKQLLQYRQGWKKAIPRLDPNMPVRLIRDPDSSSYWEWTGGVFPYVVNPQSSRQMLHLYSPGSPVRGLETKRWTVEAGSLPNGYRMLGCGIDKAQDLLVLSLAPLHFNPDSEEVYILQLLSLQRPGVPHPSASRHLLSRGLRLLTDRPEIRPPQIRGDTLACAIQNNLWEVEVWNWKIGTLLLRLRPSDFFHGFALLSQSYVLISEDVDVVRNEGSLKVYWIDPCRQNDDSEHVAPGAVLKLMPFAAGIDCLTWLSYSPETTSPDGVPPFTYDDNLSVFALFFDIESFGPRPLRSRVSEQFLLLISIRKLLCFLDHLRASELESVGASQPSTQARAGRRSVQVEWDAWGPPFTRLVAFKCAVWNTMPPTSRTRCAVAIRGVARDDTHFDYVLLLSAHPHAALRQPEGARMPASSDSDSQGDGGDVAIRSPDTVSEEEVAIAAELVSYGDVLMHPKVFRSPVRTTLPISVQCKRVPQRHGPDFAQHVEIGLFEDGLSLMYLSRVDGEMRGDTFTFSV